jgi:hypothetical protein
VEARKDWPRCGWSVDGDEDKVVVDRAVMDVEVMRQRGTKGLAGVTKGMTTGLMGMEAICLGGRRATDGQGIGVSGKRTS